VSESKLKPCPFCGNRLTVKLGHDLADNTLFGWECKGCGIASPPYPTKSDAINAANSRPDKEKVCVWTKFKDALGNLCDGPSCRDLGAQDLATVNRWQFCPYCSGRIEVKP
jgi:Lar family restriction alleviation protein